MPSLADLERGESDEGKNSKKWGDFGDIVSSNRSSSRTGKKNGTGAPLEIIS